MKLFVISHVPGTTQSLYIGSDEIYKKTAFIFQKEFY